MTISYGWTATHKYARILHNSHAMFGFWFAKGEDGSEFAINLFGHPFHFWQWK